MQLCCRLCECNVAPRTCRDFVVTSVWSNVLAPTQNAAAGKRLRYLAYPPILVRIVRTSPTGVGAWGLFFLRQVVDQSWTASMSAPRATSQRRPSPACTPAAVAVASHPPRNWCALLQTRAQQAVVADALAGRPSVGRDHHHHHFRPFHLPLPPLCTHASTYSARQSTDSVQHGLDPFQSDVIFCHRRSIFSLS